MVGEPVEIVRVALQRRSAGRRRLVIFYKFVTCVLVRRVLKVACCYTPSTNNTGNDNVRQQLLLEK